MLGRPRFLLLLALALPMLWAQQATISNVPHPTIEPNESFRFPTDQTLHYDAEWRLWKAGTGTLRIGQAGSQMHVIGTAEASGAVAVLYPVHDRLDSFFDRHTFCSSSILKHTEEGLHKRETDLHFDPVRGRAILDERNLRFNQSKHQETSAPPCVTDVLSGIFYVAAQHLEPGVTHLFPLNDGGKTVAVKAYVEGREEVKTDAGTFHTLRVAVYTDDSPLKGRGKVWIWYTDDATHLPVQMRSHLFWGTMTLRLTRVEK